jgi:hypothetical protein
VVVSSDPIATESERQSCNGAAARLDFVSANSAHITATGSGHGIHLCRPDLVVQALEWAVTAGRNGVLFVSELINFKSVKLPLFCSKQIRVDGDPGDPG